MNSADKRQFEEAAFALPFEGYENPERAKRRFLVTLFGAIGDGKLETDAAKQLLSEATAEIDTTRKRTAVFNLHRNECGRAVLLAHRRGC